MTNFAQLIKAVALTHQQLQSKAAGAVNQALTIRNYLIGYCSTCYNYHKKAS